MLLCLLGASLQVACAPLALSQAQHPGWTADPTMCQDALLTKYGVMITMLDGSLAQQGRA